jgi:uncharacterized protein (TIGR02598 family)
MSAFLKSKSRTMRLSDMRAFTLVEVVLAMGVVSFAMISMLGLLTAGLVTFHDAINATTEAEITQQLANQLELANYSSITNSGVSNYYFTMEGIPTNAASAVYLATVSAPAKLTVPGGSATYPTNTLTFVISIWSKSSPQVTNAIPIQIANNGS